MRKRLLISTFLLFLCFLGSSLFSQVDPPSLRCVAVEENGDITLTWIPPNDPNNYFLNYHLYTSVNGSPATLITSALSNRLQNTFTIVGANYPIPGATDVRFYLLTEFNDGSTKLSGSSDTLSVMNLDLTLTAPNQSGTLTWNTMRAVPLPTWGTQYNLGQNLVQVTTPPTVRPWTDNYATPNYNATSFVDNVVRCESEVSYRLQLEDVSGCVSRSNTVKAKIEDVNGPLQMTYDQISIDHIGSKIDLSWTKHPDGSVTQYIIVYIDPNGTVEFFDTTDANSTFYDYYRHPGLSSSRCFQIIPLDSCGNSQGAGEKHCTIYLDRTYDACAGEVLLKWTPYIGWNSVSEYNIYMSSDGGANYIKMGTVGENDSTFIIKNVNAFDLYRFYVEAIDGTGGFFSKSNLLNTRFNVKDGTKFCELRSASVISDNQVELTVLLDRSVPVKSLNIYRQVDNSGAFILLNSVTPPPSLKDTLFKIYDNIARPNQFAYTYFVEVIDDCGKAVLRSRPFRTIYLDGESDKFEMENFIRWNNNTAFDSTAEEADRFAIYKAINNRYAADPVGIKLKNELFYLDDIYSEIQFGSSFCYKLALFQAKSKIFESADTAFSNEICFSMEPDVFVPNSFTPNSDGVNETWRPTTSYVVPFYNYHLKIFDRWGKLMFETQDPSEGWDGIHNGGECNMGQYVYKLEIITYSGSLIAKDGYFNLVR